MTKAESTAGSIQTYILGDFMAGRLFVCGTPIGNLEDMTIRGLRILKEADIIAAEDTRNTVKLLNSFNIKTKLTAYHKFNEEEKGRQLVEEMLNGKNVALVSDAGMPGISDPGEELINLCRQNGVEVTAAPGPTAVITALVLSGIGGRSFVFEGFLPSNRRMRNIVLERLETETRTSIFYEAPHHLKETLKELYRAAGNREAAAVREITKKHEEVIRMGLKELAEYYETNEPRGEFVIVIGGADFEEIKDRRFAEFKEISIEEHYAGYIEQGMDRKEAMKAVAKDRGISKKEVYDKLVRGKG